MALNISVSADFKSACESYEWFSAGAAIKDVSTYIKFNGVDWTEVSTYVRDIVFEGSYDPVTGMSRGVTANIQLANDDLRFSDLYAAGPYYSQLLPNKEVKIDVAVSTESVTVFAGNVDDNGFFEDREGGQSTARIACQDPLRLLSMKKFDKDYIYEDMLLLDCANVASSLMHTLVVTHGGIAAANVATTGEAVSFTVEYAQFKQGQSVLQAVRSLAEASCVIYCGFRYDGKFVFDSRLEDSWTDPASEYTLTGNDFDTSVRKDLLPVAGNKVKVRGSDIQLRDSSTVLWELRKVKPIGGNATYPNMCWETVANGAYFLCDLSADPPREYYVQYEIAGEEIIETSTHVLTQTIEESASLTTTGTLLHAQPRRGRLVLKNDSGATMHVKNLVITGKAVTKKTLKTKSGDEEALLTLLQERGYSDDDANWGRVYLTEAGLSINDYGQKDIVLSSDLIVSDEQMRRIGDFLLKYGQNPRRQFTLSNLPFLVFLQLGSVVTLDLTDIGFNDETDLISFRHHIPQSGGSDTTLTLVERVPDWDYAGYVVIDGGDATGA